MKITTSQLLRKIIREEVQNEYTLAQTTIDKAILSNVVDLIKDLTDRLKKITDPEEKRAIKNNLDANLNYLKFLNKKQK
jgi:vacuolar-type H+-ATPase subunit E/Vma4